VDETTDRETLERQLEELKSAHRDLDDVIARITEEAPFDQLQIQRLKKRKLQLKDQIAARYNRLIHINNHRNSSFTMQNCDRLYRIP
jgi:hypothetical protein